MFGQVYISLVYPCLFSDMPLVRGKYGHLESSNNIFEPKNTTYVSHPFFDAPALSGCCFCCLLDLLMIKWRINNIELGAEGNSYEEEECVASSARLVGCRAVRLTS